MKSHIALTLTFFSLLLNTIFAFPADDPESNSDLEEKTKTAVRKWISKTFLDIYSTQLLPSPKDVTAGEEVYKALVDRTELVSSLHDQLDKTSLEAKLDYWGLGNPALISKAQIEAFKKAVLVDGGSNKIVRTTLREDPSRKQIAFGMVGIARTSPSRFTLSWVFAFVRLKSVPHISVSGKKGDCQIWGIYCPRTYSIQGLSSNSSRVLFEYLRDGALRDFKGLHDVEHMWRANREAEEVKGSLPVDTQEKVKELYDPKNEGKRWDEILTEDPLQWNKKIQKPEEEEELYYY